MDKHVTSVEDRIKLKQRLKSFIDWKSRKNYVSLAIAGFRFTGELDRVKCDYCNKKIVQWSDNDDPIEVHIRFSPDCVFLPTLGYSPGLPVPRHAQFSFYDDRLKSVRTVPVIYHDNLPSFSSIAESGFFYQGTLDRMSCYFCGLILKDWDATTDPMFIHIRFRPQCVHVMKLRHGGDCSADLPEDVNLRLQSLSEVSCLRIIAEAILDAGGDWVEMEGATSFVGVLGRTEGSTSEMKQDSGKEDASTDLEKDSASLGEDALTDSERVEEGVDTRELRDTERVKTILGASNTMDNPPDSDTIVWEKIEEAWLNTDLDTPEIDRHQEKISLKPTCLLQIKTQDSASDYMDELHDGEKYIEAEETPKGKPINQGSYLGASDSGMDSGDKDRWELNELQKPLESMDFSDEEIDDNELFGLRKQTPKKETQQFPEMTGMRPRNVSDSRMKTTVGSTNEFCNQERPLHKVKSLEEDIPLLGLDALEDSDIDMEDSDAFSEEPAEKVDQRKNEEDEGERLIEASPNCFSICYSSCFSDISRSPDNLEHCNYNNYYRCTNNWSNSHHYECIEKKQTVLSDMFFNGESIPEYNICIFSSLPSKLELDRSRTKDIKSPKSNTKRNNHMTTKFKQMVRYVRDRIPLSLKKLLLRLRSVAKKGKEETALAPFLRLNCILGVKNVVPLLIQAIG